MLAESPPPGLRLIQLQRYPEPRWACRYAAAVGCVALASAVNYATPDLLGRPTPFFLYYPAVLLAGFIGGFGPGALATALAGVVVATLNLAPYGSPAVAFAGDRERLALFVLFCLLLSYNKHVLHSAVRRARAAEAGLALETAKISLMMDAMPALVAYIAHDHRYVVTNQAYSSWFGLTRCGAEGKALHDVLGEPAYSIVRPHLEAALSGRDVRYAARLPYARGGARWVEARYVPDIGPDEKVRGVVSLVVDVTERRRSEARYRELFDAIDEGFCLIQVIRDERGEAVDYRFKEVNPAFTRQTGIADAVGRRMKSIAPDHEAHWFEIYGRIARSGFPERFERRAAALKRWYDVFAWRAGDADEDLVGVLFHDVTSRKLAADALRKAVEERTEELRRVAEDHEAFSYMVSHDLRAPLRAIQGYAEFIALKTAGKVDAETSDLITRISASGERMDRLIQDLLAYGRLSRGDYKMQPVDAGPIVDYVLGHYPGFEGADVRVARPLGRVVGQDSLLTQALANLLVNAVKFTAKGRKPVVEVFAEDAGPGLRRLVVEDEGVGVPEGQLTRLFQPFQRLHATGEYEGTGIGLAIVKKSAERMGGSAGAAPRPGGGMRFWLELRAEEEGDAA